jgi:hypothetical protein
MHKNLTSAKLLLGFSIKFNDVYLGNHTGIRNERMPVRMREVRFWVHWAHEAGHFLQVDLKPVLL